VSVAILLLAAGGSTRMRGGDKLLERLDGEPLLRRSARTALDSDAGAVIAITGANRDARSAALADLPIRIVHNDAWQQGMGASIAVGARALNAEVQGAIIMSADMPDLTPALLNRLIAALPPEDAQTILRPRGQGGAPGNPVLFGRAHIPALAALSGDAGARAILAAHPDAVCFVDMPGEAMLTDLDTPEAWATYRAGRRRDTKS